MTEAVVDPISVYALTGTTTGPFETSWGYEAAAEVQVWIVTVAGVQTLLEAVTDYTLTPGAVTLDDGGSVTLAVGTVPVGGWTTGDQVALIRATPVSQPEPLGDRAAITPSTVEATINRVVRQVQDGRRDLNRSVKAPLGETVGNLPKATARLGKYLRGAAGNGFEAVDLDEQLSEIMALIGSDLPAAGFSALANLRFLLEGEALARSINARFKDARKLDLLAFVGEADPGPAYDYTQALNDAAGQCTEWWEQDGVIGHILFPQRDMLFATPTFVAATEAYAILHVGTAPMGFSGAGPGSRLYIPENEDGIAIFSLGDPAYNATTNRSVPSDYLFQDLTLDLNNASQYCNGIFPRTPVKRILIDRVNGRNGNLTALNNAGSNHVKDSWFFNLSLNYVGLVAATAEVDFCEDVIVRYCDVRDYIQCTAGGEGVKRYWVHFNRVQDSLANGIALTGVGNCINIEDVQIAFNQVIDPTSRGIWVGQDDAPGRAHSMNFACPWQSRRVAIRFNHVVLTRARPAGHLIAVTPYPKGSWDYDIRDNYVDGQVSADTNAARMDWYSWSQTPRNITAATDVNITTNRITAAAHGYSNGLLVTLAPNSGGTSPGGTKFLFPYFVKVIDADTFELYFERDPTTGVFSDQLDLTSTGTGTFAVTITGCFFDCTVQDNTFRAEASFLYGSYARGLTYRRNHGHGTTRFTSGGLHGALISLSGTGNVEFGQTCEISDADIVGDRYTQFRHAAAGVNGDATVRFRPSLSYTIEATLKGSFRAPLRGRDAAAVPYPSYSVSDDGGAFAGTLRLRVVDLDASGANSLDIALERASVRAWSNVAAYGGANRLLSGYSDAIQFDQRLAPVAFLDVATGTTSTIPAGAKCKTTLTITGANAANTNNLPFQVFVVAGMTDTFVPVYVRGTGVDNQVEVVLENITAAAQDASSVTLWLSARGRLANNP